MRVQEVALDGATGLRVLELASKASQQLAVLGSGAWLTADSGSADAVVHSSGLVLIQQQDQCKVCCALTGPLYPLFAHAE